MQCAVDFSDAQAEYTLGLLSSFWFSFRVIPSLLVFQQPHGMCLVLGKVSRISEEVLQVQCLMHNKKRLKKLQRLHLMPQTAATRAAEEIHGVKKEYEDCLNRTEEFSEASQLHW